MTTSRSKFYQHSLFFTRIVTLFLIMAMSFSGLFTTTAAAMEEDPPEEWRGGPDISNYRDRYNTIQEESFGIAWADPDGPHSVYDWPYDWDQMGLVIQSYQNYSSGISSAYFHHGIDMVAPNGTNVYNRSGGQVVNIENYRAGNDLYWEVAILDAEGYVWQYHHVDESTIPQLIYDKFDEWQADPINGGFIPSDTHIGNIVYWPTVSLGYRFNHIHLNILAAGDIYINGLEFHHTRVDSQVPEIQEIGLLDGDTLVSGNTASGDYGLYVRARDLFESPVYYLPPQKTEFAMDGGDWITVWDFHTFPGGHDDEMYVNDFFVPYATEGDYGDRDFYIDLGFTTSGQRTFTSEPGEHTIEVRVWDYYGNNTSDTFTFNVVSDIPDNGCSSSNGVTRIFNITEDLIVTDVNLGVNLSHNNRGQIRVTVKSPTDATETVVIGTSSDSYNNYDVWVDDASTNSINDGNNDTTDAPYFDRTAGPSTNGALDSFDGKTTFGEWTVFVCDNTGGTSGTVNQIDLDVQGIDNNNTQPVADPQSVETAEDTPVGITLTGSDADGDPLTFDVISGPSHGSLSGTAPNLTYTPDADYNGSDSFVFVTNDGAVDSEEATVSINVTPVNDAPVATQQSVGTDINNAVVITLVGTDIDGDTLTFAPASSPAHGTLGGTAPNLTYTPDTGYSGSDSFDFIANDGSLDSSPATVSITVNPPGPVTVFWDDFESSSGWDEDPYGNDDATTGFWEVANPEETSSSGYIMQLGDAYSGSQNLVTEGSAGSSVGTYDIDNGETSILSPEISLPAGRELTLSFYYYLGHLSNGTTDDYLRVSVVGDTTQLVLEELGSGDYDAASWASFSTDISAFAGQDVHILIAAADAGSGSLIEAGVDDVLIEGILTNNPPSADSQSVSTNEDSPLAITLTGSDPDGDPLSYTVASGPSHGSLSGTAPNLTYTPDANFNGSDSFTFTVNDGQATSSPATVDITINPINDAPTADPQSVSTDEDTPVAITLTGSDVDGDSLSFAVSSGPSHGNLSGTAPDLTYTPDAGYNGADSFIFTANDGSLTSDPAVISITVNEVNDPPTADDQDVTTAEDTPALVTLTGSDPEEQPLTYAVVSGPSHGSLSGTAPDLTYTPDAHYNGSDSFTFKVNDGQLDSGTAAVDITVTPVNDAPTADPQSVSTDEDTPVAITLTGSDIENSLLTFTVETQPSQGTLSGIAPDLTYTPDVDYFGSDSFTFSVSDGDLGSGSATVNITVNSVNDAPTADPRSVTTDEDTPSLVTLTGSDVENSPLTFSVASVPSHGSLSGTAPDLTYTPDADYNGSDSFTFTVNDSEDDSAPAAVSITVNPVNDAPTADSQSVSTNEDTPVAITLTGSDVDEDSLSFTISSGPSHGSLSGTAPDLTYTPDPGYFGADSFNFTASDGSLTSDPAVVSITVNEVNDPPTANDQDITTAEDTPSTVTLTGSDPDGDSTSYEVLTQPSHGSLSGTAPGLTYTPDANYNGSDSFTFKVNDGQLDSDPATVDITITPVNDGPTADPQSVSTDEDTPVAITLTGSDVENSTLTFTVETQPVHGTLSGTAPDLTYTPDSDYNGSDSFSFSVSDGELGSGPATVDITVESVNDAPTANSQSVSIDEDTPTAITLTGSDVENNPLTYSISVGPSHGTLSGTAPDLTYTPDPDYNGSDSFTFTVNDGSLTSAPAMVSITIDPVNDAPVADPQSVGTTEDTPVAITLTGSDVEEDPLSFAIFSGPSHGSLSGTAPDLTYTPDAGYEGADSFSFTVNDGSLTSAPAVVSITVSEVNDPPTANDQDITTAEDTPATVTLTGSDPDGDPISYEVLSQPSHGSLSGTAPNLTYTPDADYHGSDSFTFMVNDGFLDSDPATVSITVTPVNDAPSADPQSVSTDEDTQVAITLTGSDIENDPLTFTIETQPAHGTLGGTAPDLTYTPDADFNGSDSFTFSVSDGSLSSGPATVNIMVNSVNDVPTADPQSVSTDEDTAVVITLTGSDVENSPLTFAVETQPAHGTLSGTAPDLTYTPDANYNGSDSFTFTVSDGEDDSASAAVSITVDPVNDAPVADPQSVSTDEDTPVAITLTGSDVEEDPLTFTVETQPLHGTLSGTAPDLTYTPDADFNSSDSFTFSVSDGSHGSGPATVDITVNSVNDAPTADPQYLMTDEDVPLAVTLTGSDPENSPLTFSIASGPSHGTLTGTAPNLTYTPDANFNGTDSFTFTVNDGEAESDPVTVEIIVYAINDAPVADSQSVTTDEDTPVDITLTGSDVENDPLTFSIASGPSHGTLSGTAPDLTYTPDTGYDGGDSFSFTVNDGSLPSNPAVVSITVSPSGPLQVFWDDFESDLGWTLNPDSDDTATTGMWERAIPEEVDYNGLKQLGTTVSGSYDLVTGPLAGRSAGEYDIDSGVTSILSPEIELPGGRELTLSFSQYLSHYSNSSSDDFLRVTIIGDTTELVFEDLGASTDVDAVWKEETINLSSFADQTIQILIQAADAGSGSLVEAGIDDVLILALEPNTIPTAYPKSASLLEDTSVDVTLTGSDADGDPITFEIVETPQHGALSGSMPTLTYTPDPDFNGSDSFTYSANDGIASSAPALVDITVTPVNDAPVAEPQSLTAQADTDLHITLGATDVDGDALNFTIVSQPDHGTLSGTAPDLIYSPDTAYTGDDSFTFKADDGELESATVQVSITVESSGPGTVFFDDFESNQGWSFNPDSTDTAIRGNWERAVAETTSRSGYKQLEAYSGSYDLVTGHQGGSWWTAGRYDIDNGVTSVLSPEINLPGASNINLSFMYYFAHTSTNADDYFRVTIIGSSSVVVFEELGFGSDDDAVWESFSTNLNAFAGQTIQILLEAADEGSGSIVEAAVDDVLIVTE